MQEKAPKLESNSASPRPTAEMHLRACPMASPTGRADGDHSGTQNHRKPTPFRALRHGSSPRSPAPLRDGWLGSTPGTAVFAPCAECGQRGQRDHSRAMVVGSACCRRRRPGPLELPASSRRRSRQFGAGAPRQRAEVMPAPRGTARAQARSRLCGNRRVHELLPVLYLHSLARRRHILRWPKEPRYGARLPSGRGEQGSIQFDCTSEIAR
jgi:hypothetical protein